MSTFVDEHSGTDRTLRQVLQDVLGLSAALFEQVIDRDRVEWVDFGTGDDPYKRDWMEQVRPRWRLTCLRAGDPRNWPTLAKALARKLVSRPAAG